MNSPETPSELRDLESKLSQLRPAVPSSDLVRRLLAKAPSPDAGEAEPSLPGLRLVPKDESPSHGPARQRESDRVVWLRVLPVAAAAALACAAIVLWGTDSSGTRPSSVANSEAALPPVAEASAQPKTEATTSPAPRPASPWTQGGFQPVSMQQQLRSANDRGVKELEKGKPVREIQLQIDETQQWEDPETRTEIRIIQPREETIYVPVTPR